MPGFTLTAVSARIRNLDNDVQWKLYTALAALAKLRGTKKSTLATMVFGKDKPSKAFNNAWSLSAKFFAAGLSDSTKKAITDQPIDEAVNATLAALAAHMTALGVNGKNAYDAVAEYTSKDAIPTAEAEPEAAPEEAEVTGESVVEPETGAPAEVQDVVGKAKALIEGMTMDEMNAIAIFLNDRMVAMATTDTQQMAA
ncbi:hypothetical protein [Mesorhizobium sp. STM 4661]|uniref:hypothetical protein n=1 Tax=Mesorhizobium sp. STM 4661 TaxID=1297570 RepID=UPI0002BD6AE8|nr:hypothetical protein [Mesorhizobium sp. STM 4661]CCV12954.1 hypothetical protein MESS4_510121 [Mesorhizobium sp. STM 4661]